MKKFYVYVHVCPNGKRYVGATTASKPERRWAKGRGYKHQLFEEAILKYGWDNIEHEVFEVDSREEMYRKEIELISFYHTNDPEYGYNNSVGGEHGHLGCSCSEETRRKISKTLTGRHHPRVKIQLPDGTIVEVTKNNLVKNYMNKGKKFEYVS